MCHRNPKTNWCSKRFLPDKAEKALSYWKVSLETSKKVLNSHVISVSLYVSGWWKIPSKMKKTWRNRYIVLQKDVQNSIGWTFEQRWCFREYGNKTTQNQKEMAEIPVIYKEEERLWKFDTHKIYWREEGQRKWNTRFTKS